MSAHRVQDDVVQVEEKLSFWARAIAVQRSVIVGAAGTGLAYAAHRGWITPDFSTEARDDIAVALTGLATVGAGAWIHRGTTPAAQGLQPRNSDGQPLVPDPAVADAVLDESDDPTLAAAVLGMDHVAETDTPTIADPSAHTDNPGSLT